MIVMKFGGTSVADARAIRRLVEAVTAARGESPLVVVSAMAKVTDALLQLERAVLANDLAALESGLGELHRRHLGVAADLGVTSAVEDELAAGFARLRRMLDTSMGAPLPVPLRDQLAGTGEVLSSHVVTAALAAAGLPAEWLDAGLVIRTDDRFGSAMPRMAEIAREACTHVKPRVAAGRILVTQGFVGRTKDGRPTTLGRGGSDFSAALFGSALDATRVEIWTDVDGLMTADPRIVPGARVLRQATYDEAAELAAFGAKVLHPATQLPLVLAGIPIHIRNTFAPERPGTMVSGDTDAADGGAVRSISFKKGVTVVQVSAPRMLGAFGFLRQLFEIFERHEIIVDVLATSEVSVSLTVDDASRLARAAPELSEMGEFSTRSNRGVVAVVGRAIREMPGVAARVYSAIPDVNVEMISQGASASNLTFIVREEDGPDVVRALHREFFPEDA